MRNFSLAGLSLLLALVCAVQRAHPQDYPQKPVRFIVGFSPGGGSDIGSSISVDAAGDIYFTGWYSGTVDFDPGIGVYNLTPVANSDIFVVKLSITTALNTIEKTNSLITTKVFPNPNNGVFKIQIDNDIKNGQLILINSLGTQHVKRMDIFSEDLSSLAFNRPTKTTKTKQLFNKIDDSR